MKQVSISEGKVFHKHSPPPKKGGEWIQDPEFHETRKMFGRSFAGIPGEVRGEPLYSWAVNHLPEWFARGEDNSQSAAFGTGFRLHAGLKRKALVVSKRYEDQVASAALVHEFDPQNQGGLFAKIVEGWNFMHTLSILLMQEKLSKLFTDSKYSSERNRFEKKINAMETSLKKWHLSDGPKELHWYIELVAVAPDFNGKGFGRELMEQVNHLADQVGKTVYLECGASNLAFYEKMEYIVVSHRQLHDSVEPEAEPCDVYMMVRKPKLPN